ncbi:MAG TPA: hypothetical protein VJM49_08345, partial [Acidimicrobiales bacterium]|nr:hypothetical protein [Acidimicrobiales bacterium]
KSIGFVPEVVSGSGSSGPGGAARDTAEVFSKVMPEDLLKFGMIPEFIGRLPVITTVAPLDTASLVRILTEPRNALVKQYQKMFEIDGVVLEFTEDAVEAVADQALARGTGGVGFTADVQRYEDKDLGKLLEQVQPEDLLKFGLIPEFVGRLPVIGAVSSLDHEALIRILNEPKNALIKQYRKIFEFEDVELEFADDALEAIADQALLRGTGARGLRAILEEVLLDLMYELPSRSDVGKCVVDRAVVLERVNPTLVPRSESTRQQRPRRAAS